MPPKKKGNKENKLSRYRKRTEDKHEFFAIILADEENSFVVNLEKLALKKSSNSEIFAHIKKEMDKQLKTNEFKK